MSFRTVELSSFEEYLRECYPETGNSLEEEDRDARLSRFPHVVMLKVAFPELDFANRWCWQQFGPYHGECQESYSEYRTCRLAEPHSHHGTWAYYFFEKIDYDFGFCEWYFTNRGHFERFLANVENINWGESYPK